MRTNIFGSVVYACIVGYASFSSAAQAHPKDDAEYIVGQTVTRAMFQGAISAQRPLIVGALENELRSAGLTLPDPDRFFDLFMAEFMEEFLVAMQEQTASLYLENFSEQQLADVADFYRTDSGQALISATPVLMIEGSRMGQIAGQRAGANSGRRLAARIESEGLIVVDDPSLMSRLLDALK